MADVRYRGKEYEAILLKVKCVMENAEKLIRNGDG